MNKKKVLAGVLAFAMTFGTVTSFGKAPVSVFNVGNNAVSESLRLFVPVGFVPVVVCSTILMIMTYAERKTGAPLGYDQSK